MRLFILGFAADMAAGDVTLEEIPGVLRYEHSEDRFLSLTPERMRSCVAALVRHSGNLNEWPPRFVREWADTPDMPEGYKMEVH